MLQHVMTVAGWVPLTVQPDGQQQAPPGVQYGRNSFEWHP